MEAGGARHDSVLNSLALQWESDLLDCVLPFWQKYSVDRVNGGYWTCIDGDGSIYCNDKFMWLNGRQVYMLSRMYCEGGASTTLLSKSKITKERRRAWLESARVGASFLDKAKCGDGNQLFFSVDETGERKLHFQRKVSIKKKKRPFLFR